MTKEQAIMYLRSMQGICSPRDRMAKEAVRMATDALSEPSGDLISREDALRELNGACSNWQDDSQVADIINGLPSDEGGDAEMNPIPEGTGVMIQSPNNGADDLISRADAIEAVCGDCTIENRESCKRDGYCYEVRNLMALPSAEAVSREEYESMKRANEFNMRMCSEVEHELHDLKQKQAEAVQGDGRNNIKRYPNCQMRTSLGNCDAIGGFCTSINAPICDAFHKLVDAVQGEWIDIDNYYRLATCSHCHKVTMFEKWGEHTKPYDFCPNCGARMYKGGGDE